MIIDARYEGPPYANGPYGVLPPASNGVSGCTSCVRKPANLGNISPLAGLSYTTVGTLVLSALAALAIGLTLYSFNGKKKQLSGRRRRR